MKGKTDWGKSGISELVEAAECITYNNVSSDGKMLYNIDEYFDGWKRKVIKDRMKILYGDKANISPNNN